MKGILCLYDERIRELANLIIFVHCDPDVSLCRRLLRDISERGRDIEEVLKRYNRFVKPDFEKFVLPQMKHADLIVPNTSRKNNIALNLLVDHVNSHIEKRERLRIKERKMKLGKDKKGLERIRHRRKMSHTSFNRFYEEAGFGEAETHILDQVSSENHIPFSKMLRKTSHHFFQQLFVNPDENMLSMNIEYLRRNGLREVLAAMCSDFQIQQPELEPIIKNISLNSDPENVRPNINKMQIFFIQHKSILHVQALNQALEVIKTIDDFPVYLFLNFIDRNSAYQICTKSPNTHLFSLFYIEEGFDFSQQLSAGIQKILLSN